MTIERKIRIHDRDFYLGVELKYGKGKLLKKLNGSGFDMGDMSIMIEDVQNNYDKDLVYDKEIAYMNDIIYLYDRFPFVSYIKDVSYNIEGKIAYVGCINKDEIIDYIKENKIEINRWDKSKCQCPLLYK